MFLQIEFKQRNVAVNGLMKKENGKSLAQQVQKTYVCGFGTIIIKVLCYYAQTLPDLTVGGMEVESLSDHRVVKCDVIILQTFPFEPLNLILRYTQLL